MSSSDDPKSPPLEGASESDINRLVDDVLRSGKHMTMPDSEAAQPERYHARVLAGKMQALAEQLSAGGKGPRPDAPADVDEWWFEVHGKRIGPISLHKIRMLWDDGELTPDSLCWHQGFPKWVSLFKVSELAEALTPKLDVKVDLTTSSAEWASPAGSAMEAANRKKLELSQHKEAALPLSTPLNLSDERAATYTALNTIADEPAPAPSAMKTALMSGLVSGVIAAVTVVVMRMAWPVTVPPPIIITMGGAPAPVAAAVVTPEPPKPAPAPEQPRPAAVAVPAPAPAPVAAAPKPAPAPAAAPAPAPAPAPAQGEPGKPKTVEEAFAKAFAEAPPDELTIGEVMEVVKNHKPAIDACAEAAHAANAEDPGGRIVMKWSVETDGRVTDVVAPDGAFGECLAKDIARWTFPKHALQHPPVEIPFKY